MREYQYLKGPDYDLPFLEVEEIRSDPKQKAWTRGNQAPRSPRRSR